MTGYDVIKRARVLLGFSGENTVCAASALAAQEGLEIINQLCADLSLDGISSLSDLLNASAAKQEALCYGTAMLLALTEGDAGKNQIFANIYNAKRGTALAQRASIEDCLPNVTVG